MPNAQPELRSRLGISNMDTSFTAVGVFALLGLGLVFGLKHATEVDHVVAVSMIVSEHRSVVRSNLMQRGVSIFRPTKIIIVWANQSCRTDCDFDSQFEKECK